MTLRNQTKRAAGQVSAVLHRALGDRGNGKLGILGHHCIHPTVAGVPEAPYNVPPARFRAQLTGLLDAGYTFVKMADVLASRRTDVSLPKRSVLLTFDDAYESVYEHALPIMRELNVPGVAYLATAFIDSQKPFPFDGWAVEHRTQLPPPVYRPLATPMCHELLASGLFELGAHTHSHGDWRGQPEKFQADMAQSVEIVKQQFQLSDVSCAFPYGGTRLGHAGGAMALAAKASGACCALTTDGELVDPLVDDPFNWGRFIVFSWDTAATIAAKLAGWYGWARGVRNGMSRLRRAACTF